MPLRPCWSIGPSISSRTSERICRTRSGRIPTMLVSNAAWCSLQSASPFGTIGSPPGVPVRQDVRGIEKLRVMQPAHGAAQLVGAKNLLPEICLVQTSQGDLQLVRQPRVFVAEHELPAGKRTGLVHLDGERQGRGVVTDDVDRPDGEVLRWDDAVE